MTNEEFIEVFENEETNWEGDNAFQGLMIIAKYIDPIKNDIICAGEHDIIYSVDIEKLIEAGITLEDANKLRELNWIIEDDSYLACFV